MAWSVPWNLVGIIVSGDVGDDTIYTDRQGRKVPFPKSPPKEPPSPQQSHQRARFRTAQASWSALSQDDKQNWEDACRRTSVPLTGQNLWIHAALCNDASAVNTIARQSGIGLTPPAYVP